MSSSLLQEVNAVVSNLKKIILHVNAQNFSTLTGYDIFLSKKFILKFY